ncbi:MAG: Rieske 2Fe-2S domain-containing protein [Gemmatimonadota bacterium]
MTPDTTKCSGCALRTSNLSRRDFVSAATLSAVAVVLTACGGDDGPTGPISPGVGEISVRITDYPALGTVGAVAKVRNSPPVALARTSEGFVAFSMSCTHRGSTVVIDDDYTIFCPNHGAEYTATGVWRGGQKTSSLVRLPVVVDDASVNATITLG